MEIKIPREVRKYQESIFFGLSLRQFLCSVIAIGISVFAYFSLHKYLGTEGVTWICIFVAFPVASLGFISYHGMTLEHFIWAYIKSEWLMPKKLIFFADNYMYMSYSFVEQTNAKERKKNKKEKRNEYVKHIPKNKESRKREL